MPLGLCRHSLPPLRTHEYANNYRQFICFSHIGVCLLCAIKIDLANYAYKHADQLPWCNKCNAYVMERAIVQTPFRNDVDEYLEKLQFAKFVLKKTLARYVCSAERVKYPVITDADERRNYRDKSESQLNRDVVVHIEEYSHQQINNDTDL